MVALDARALRRPKESLAEMISYVHEHGCLSVADIATYDEGMRAAELGADIVATTFAPRFRSELVERLAANNLLVLAEGQVDSAELARCAIQSGAWAVCVGTAITRPHIIAGDFAREIVEAIR
jgi:N-acylglucosamine-6-phosphate 2-epimerase